MASLTKALPAGEHDVLFKLEKYLPDSFEIEVVAGVARTYHRTLHPLSGNMLDLDHSEIPTVMYAETKTDFSFAVKNTSAISLKFQVVLDFTSAEQKFEFSSDWTDSLIAPGQSISIPLSATLSSSAIPEGESEATYVLYVKLIASSQ